jgi:hypothetical protein
MSALLDDISRITASPISRREAFKLVGGAVGGALLASLGLGRASRGLGAPVPTTKCPSSRPVLLNGKCYPTGYFLCGGRVCDKDDQCCNSDHCCEKRQTCCGKRCCDSKEQCCTDHCCDKRETCCGNRCCAPGLVCCNGRCCRKGPSASNPCYKAYC